MKTTRDDPGQVEGNVIFTFLDAFELDEAKVCELKAHCRRVNVSNSAQPAAR
jgi:tryptophanyl-tRNA synthetase